MQACAPTVFSFPSPAHPSMETQYTVNSNAFNTYWAGMIVDISGTCGTNTGPPSSSKLWRTYNSLYIAQEVLFAVNNELSRDSIVVSLLRDMGISVEGGCSSGVPHPMGCVAVARTDIWTSADPTWQRTPYIMAAATNLILVILTVQIFLFCGGGKFNMACLGHNIQDTIENRTVNPTYQSAIQSRSLASSTVETFQLATREK
ncbi:hypothetical protein B0H13DRAFT_1877631 [Mycena leptocephala]|nr:hypothetical protein B0H13DRAFT_1877631 [Mycena leptocephala]